MVWIGALQPHNKVSPSLLTLNSQHATRVPSATQQSPEHPVVGSKLDLHVLMASTVDSEAVLQQWVEHLTKETSYSQYCRVTIIKPTPPKFVVHLHFTNDASATNKNEVITSIVDYLSAQPLCHWIEAHTPPVLANKYGREVLISTSDMQHTSPPLPHAALFDSLKGDGQVVGVADTGIDTQHAFFYDATGDIRSTLNQVDNTRRKVILYYAYGDAVELTDGHGTHVVCI